MACAFKRRERRILVLISCVSAVSHLRCAHAVFMYLAVPSSLLHAASLKSAGEVTRMNILSEHMHG